MREAMCMVNKNMGYKEKERPNIVAQSVELLAESIKIWTPLTWHIGFESYCCQHTSQPFLERKNEDNKEMIEMELNVRTSLS